MHAHGDAGLSFFVPLAISSGGDGWRLAILLLVEPKEEDNEGVVLFVD